MAFAKEKGPLVITPMNECFLDIPIIGTAPLVVHRFDEKVKEDFENKIISGSIPLGKKRHDPRVIEEIFEAAKYYGKTGNELWEGFNASGIRNAMVSACRLVGFKMTLARLCIFTVEDGRDTKNPLFSLVRIIGESRISKEIGRNTDGVAMLIIRPIYFPWEATVRVRFDGDIFSYTSIANLVNRVGKQVGICEGRPDSKNSAGMDWGTFEIKR
jgi:hypothetical protein